MSQSNLLSYFAKKRKKPDATSSQPPSPSSPQSAIGKQNLGANEVDFELSASSSSTLSSVILTNNQQTTTVENQCQNIKIFDCGVM